MSLEQLWEEVTKLNKLYFPSDLVPIVGNGKTEKPKVLFLFINPTHANISSRSNWRGPCFPFCGTKQIWRIFHRAGLFDDSLMREVELSREWSVALAERVLGFLKTKGFYFTNVVKSTGADASLPGSQKIKLFLPILCKEIELVKPQNIVTFGLIPFKALMNKNINLNGYFKNIMRKRAVNLEYEGARVIPCYFPTGRGNPARAIEILKLLAKNL